MITADQLVAHLVGDYLLQSDWMAQRKRTSSIAALTHAIAYTIPFLFIAGSASWLACSVIIWSHFLIDRFGLARYVVWAKNFLAPRWMPRECGCEPPCPQPYVRAARIRTRPWSKCQKTGYPPDRPEWLAVWLLIIADNVLHILINAAALRWL